MMELETKTYAIRGKAHIEGAQTGYIVSVDRKGTTRGDLATYPYGTTTKEGDEAYRSATLTANSINRGKFITTRGEWTLSVKGKKITATRTVARKS